MNKGRKAFIGLLTTGVFASAIIGPNFQNKGGSGKITYAVESTTLTTNDGSEVEIKAEVPIIVKAKNTKTYTVSTVDGDGNQVEGTIPKDECTELQNMPEDTDVNGLQFAIANQPVNNDIANISVYETPRLRRTWK